MLKFDASIQDAPPMIPIQKSQTNEKGEYYFAGVKKEAEIEYLIGALIQGNRISSNRIQLKENQQEILNLEYFGIPSLEKRSATTLKKSTTLAIYSFLIS